MMEAAELILLLLDTPGIGEQSLGAVLRRNAISGRSPEEFLSLPVHALAVEYGIRRSAAELLLDATSSRRSVAEEQARWLRRTGVNLVTLLDASYPQRLVQRLDTPPPVLFLYGNPALLDRPLFAVANSNGAAEPALAAGDQAAEAALAAGWSLVTGHNRIPYQRPALAVRRNGGQICYVLDRGMIRGFGGDLSRALFPAARIWGPAYDPACDLTLSPFGLQAHGIATNNRRRDTLVFALADAIFACEVRPGGQMERECLAALRRGTPLYLYEGGACDPRLLDAGAKPVAAASWPPQLSHA
jgi:hypothetical protein